MTAPKKPGGGVPPPPAPAPTPLGVAGPGGYFVPGYPTALSGATSGLPPHVNPFLGNYLTYGYGPEHQFIDYSKLKMGAIPGVTGPVALPGTGGATLNTLPGGGGAPAAPAAAAQPQAQPTQPMFFLAGDKFGGAVKNTGGLIATAEQMKKGGIAEAARIMAPGHHGLVRDDTPGRADKVLTRVPVGTYIVPADVVGAMGDGNTEAGRKALDHYCAKCHHMASGGPVEEREVYLSGGEYRIPHHVVRGLGKGDLDAGARKLDREILKVRRKHITHLKKLPGPKK